MNVKKLAGEKAVEYVRDGMTIGLGTGSTVYWTIRKLGELVKQRELQIRAIPTSQQTSDLANELGIPLETFAQATEVDLTIDGADEFNSSLDLMKGGGGALVREKLVAAASNRLIIVADESKLVEKLGKFPLPVEVVPFAWEVTAKRIEGLNCVPTLRRVNGCPYVSDNGNYILDCSFGYMENPAKLDRTIKLLPGVVDTGLFISMADTVIIGTSNGLKVLSKNN